MSFTRDYSIDGKFEIIDFGILLKNPENPSEIETNGCFYLCAAVGKNLPLLSGSIGEIQYEAFKLKRKLTTGDYNLVEFRRKDAAADENVMHKFVRTSGYQLRIYDEVIPTETGWIVESIYSVLDKDGQKHRNSELPPNTREICLGLANYNHYVLLLPVLDFPNEPREPEQWGDLRDTKHIPEKTAQDFLNEAFTDLFVTLSRDDGNI